jgi:hypothetical protein
MSCISGSLQVPIVELRNPFQTITGRSQGFACFMEDGRDGICIFFSWLYCLTLI